MNKKHHFSVGDLFIVSNRHSQGVKYIGLIVSLDSQKQIVSISWSDFHAPINHSYDVVSMALQDNRWRHTPVQKRKQ